MGIQFSQLVRNARANAIEAAIGASPTMTLRTGAQPVDCAAPDTGTVVATLPLPTDWMADAAAAVKALTGSWSDSAADATGTPGHYRIKQGSTCHMQGSVGATGSGANLELNDITIEATQPIAITAFQITEGNG